MRLLLASASPRRAALLAAAGFAFDVFPSEIDEDRHHGEDPSGYVLRLARAKAAAVARAHGDRIVIGADTTVLLDGQILGKPEDERHAVEMLTRLAGRTHDVLTAVSVRRNDMVLTDVETTRVWFAPLSREQIDWYVASGEPNGKAGAYAIQGLASRFVNRIEGSYTNVVGLPISVVYRFLRELGEEP